MGWILVQIASVPDLCILFTWNFGFRKWRNCTIYEAKTKVLINCAVTAQLICVFVFAYAQLGFIIARLICKYMGITIFTNSCNQMLSDMH